MKKSKPKPLKTPPPRAQSQPFLRSPDVNITAALAATLAASPNIKWSSYFDLATEAIRLWRAADYALDGQKHLDQIIAQKQKWDAEDRPPNPKSFPIKWEEFGRLLLPQSRVEDRAKWVRDFIKAQKPPPSEAGTYADYRDLARRFLNWHYAQKKEKAQTRARAGGNAKATKTAEDAKN